MAAHSIILAWRIPWTEEPGGLQFTGHIELDVTERLSQQPPPLSNLLVFPWGEGPGSAQLGRASQGPPPRPLLTCSEPWGPAPGP